jgi:hypothetical protein
MGVPVKRRRALLASIPLRNSRPKLIATMGRAQNFPITPTCKMCEDSAEGDQ